MADDHTTADAGDGMKIGTILSIGVPILIAVFGGQFFASYVITTSGDDSLKEIIAANQRLVDSNTTLIKQVSSTLSDLTLTKEHKDQNQDMTIAELNATITVAVSNLGDRIERSNKTLRDEIKDSSEALRREIREMAENLTAVFKKDFKYQEQLLEDRFQNLHEELKTIREKIAFTAPSDDWLRALKSTQGNWIVYDKERFELPEDLQSVWADPKIRWLIIDTRSAKSGQKLNN